MYLNITDWVSVIFIVICFSINFTTFSEKFLLKKNQQLLSKLKIDAEKADSQSRDNAEHEGILRLLRSAYAGLGGKVPIAPSRFFFQQMPHRIWKYVINHFVFGKKRKLQNGEVRGSLFTIREGIGNVNFFVFIPLSSKFSSHERTIRRLDSKFLQRDLLVIKQPLCLSYSKNRCQVIKMHPIIEKIINI